MGYCKWLVFFLNFEAISSIVYNLCCERKFYFFSSSLIVLQYGVSVTVVVPESVQERTVSLGRGTGC